MFVLLLLIDDACFSHLSRERLLAASFSPFFPKKSILVSLQGDPGGRPRGITRRHRSRIPVDQGGWADEQSVHVVAWGGPVLSPHSLRSGQALSAAKGLSRWAPRCFAALRVTGLSCCRASAIGARSACSHPFWPSQPLLTILAPPAVDGLFASLMPLGRPWWFALK